MKWLFRLVFLAFGGLVLAGCTLGAPPKAGLQVITNDVPVSIFLDGQYLDKTPLINKDLKPGTYTLKIAPEDNNLASFETTITLHKGLLTVVTWKPGPRPELSGGVIYEMEKLANKKATQLALISIPDGAIVSLDDQAKEFAPLVLDDVAPGQHEFTVSLPSYDTQQHTLNMVAGHKINITVKLARSAGAGAETSTPSATPKTASDSASLVSTSSASLSAKTATPKPSPSPSPTSKSKTASASATSSITGPRVRIKPTNFYNDDQEVLRVRSKPSSAGTSVGFAPVGQEYPYLNETMDGWLKITFEGKTGWVSGQFAELLGTN